MKRRDFIRNSVGAGLLSGAALSFGKFGDIIEKVHKKIMDAFEKELLKMALRKSNNRTEAMKLLGLSRRAFYLKLNKYDLIKTSSR